MRQTLKEKYVNLPVTSKKSFKAKVREWLAKELEDRYDDIVTQTDGITSFVVPTPYAAQLAEYVKREVGKM
jgi:hypothetical protein